ncbi:competence protein ComK [Sporosarcina siberiensis]|uniref:Competence protein ComK n=1 Tax=Sporosarcina siberiensis TaxID=1365606 RepID=A0ABW4SD91_9BACL
MNRSGTYVIKRETMYFNPKHDKHGYLYTHIVETDRVLKIALSPTELIDQNLRYFGSSFKGASQGSRAILGNVTMCPIVANEKLDFYWFPTKSPTSPNCIWFALHHIDRHESICKKKTKVFLSNGTTLDIELSAYSFERKIQRAYKLKYKIEERTRLNSVFVNESNVLYDIYKQDVD